MTFFILPAGSNAIPPPCSEGELLDSSDYAIEGTVSVVECGKPYDSGECRPQPDSGAEFKPELVSKCTANVLVTKSIKGEYKEGAAAPVPFLKVTQSCENGSHIIPGSPKANLAENMRIRYCDSQTCRYSNLRLLPAPTPGPGN